jgi:hypothetical protein
MKFLKPILVVILMSPAILAFSQTYSDFIVIDKIADNYAQLESEFSGQANVYWPDGSSPNAIEQISITASTLQIENLHIYAPTKPGAIVFNSIAITTRNLDELAEQLSVWSNLVTHQVVIHSEVVFTGDDGILLKQRLEEITGLVFTMQN